jgi:O-acetyl-ADP-ribose deacetylase (regulator of RNase III)
MTVNYVVGDLFDQKVDAIGHGVNCKGKMGAGIATQFRKREPIMYAQYQERCEAGLIYPGEVFTWFGNDHIIFNIASQDQPGPDASLAFLSSAMFVVENLCNRNKWSVALPWIGCGIGGLDKADVTRVFNIFGKSMPYGLTVVTHPSDVE